MSAPIIHDDGKTNPVIEVPRNMVIEWLRSIADRAGYADRASSAVQLVIELHPVYQRPPEETEVLVIPRSSDRKSAFWMDAPSLILMVSNISNSREAPLAQVDPVEAVRETVAALEKRLTEIGDKPRVKGLSWTEPAPPTEGVSFYDHCLAGSSIGPYRIEWKSWKKYDAYCVYGPCEFFASEPDLEQAKAAAFAHLSACILASLEEADGPAKG